MTETDSLQVRDPTEQLSTHPRDLLGVLHFGIEKGLGIEGVREIVTLIREEQDRQAAREFAADFAEFQRECPPVPKTSSASFVTSKGTKIAYTYPELDEIASTVNPHLHPRGFSYSWDCKIENDIVEATCFLRHRNGHSISARFPAPIDSSSVMNATQKAAMALTYAKRQSLVQVLGLTTTEPDTDVQREGVTTITREQINELQDLLGRSGADIALFFAYMKRDSFDAFTTMDYIKAKGALLRKVAEKEKA